MDAEYIGALELALTLLSGKQLPTTEKHRSVPVMDVNTERMSVITRRAATRATREHAGLRKLYEQDVSQSSLARELGETRSRVVSWFAEGPGNRPIPRKTAERIRDKYGLPLSVWARIAE